MMLLAIDTSTHWVGLALYDGHSVPAEMIWQPANRHTVELAPAIADLLHRGNIINEDLTALAVALGPGSFTSLRIGLAAAKGLAFALRLPIVGVPTLDITAAGQPVRDLPLAAVLQAGRGRLAVGWYQAAGSRWEANAEVEVQTAEELSSKIHSPTLVAGELSASDRQTLARKRRNVILSTPAHSLRRPSFLAEMAWKRWQAGQQDNAISLAPIYLHTAEAIPE